MISYHPGKVILTDEDAVRFAEAQLKELGQKVCNGFAPWSMSRLADIAKGKKEGSVTEEIRIAREPVAELIDAANGLQIVCEEENRE